MPEKETSLIETGCGVSRKRDPFEAGVDAARQAMASIGRHPLSAVLVFASVRFPPRPLVEGIRFVTGSAPLIGASTAGEICGELQNQSVVVSTLASPHLQMHAAVGRQVSSDWRSAVEEAAGAPGIRAYFSLSDPSREPDFSGLRREGKSVFGLLLSPGNTRTADSRSMDILQALQQRCRRTIPFCGGSSADDWRLEMNHVFHDGDVHEDGMIVAIFETQLQNGMGIAHGFSPTSQKLLVTQAKGRVVHEIDHRRADEAYADLVGIPAKDLAGRHLTLATGRPVGFPDPTGDYTINVASFFTETGGIRFSQPVAEGAQLTLMAADMEKMVGAGRQALQKALFRGGIQRPAFVLVFSCALRHKLLQEKAAAEISGIHALAQDACVSGFVSFGEQGLADQGGSCHGNELVSILALGADLSPAAEVWFENQQLLEEKNRAESALLAANAFKKAVIEHIAEGLCVFHETDRYPYVRFAVWNERMVALTGYRMDDINHIRRNPLGLSNPDIHEKAGAVLARLRAGDHLQGEEWVITAKDGTRRTVAVSTNTLPPIGGRRHVLALLYDLTRQKTAEQERLALERRAQHFQKFESLCAMAGGIAHDFNNILMIILGNIELARHEAPAASPLRPHLREMEKSVFKAADLTRKILTYTGKSRFVLTEVDLDTVVSEACRTLATSLPETVSLRVRPQPGLPKIRTDRARISQITANLAANAAEAFEPGSHGRICLATGTKFCDAAYLASAVTGLDDSDGPPAEGLYVFLEVSDNGRGMDEKALGRIFDPFYTTKFQGRGLGMSTVLGIVRGLHGAIRLRSTPGEGTTIRILLPVLAEGAPACDSSSLPVAITAGGKGAPRTILLVDDEFKIRRLARTMLERLGYRVLTAADGMAAIRIYREKFREIHCVLIDLGMPELNGKAVFEKLRRLDPDICVILSSSYTEADVMAQFGKRRPSGFIQKPYRFQSLGTKLKAILDQVPSDQAPSDR